MTRAATIRRGRRPSGWIRASITWLAVMGIAGIVCPHCVLASSEAEGPGAPGGALSADAHAAPPCHAPPPSSPALPSPSLPPMADCDCAGCDATAESVPPAASAAQDLDGHALAAAAAPVPAEPPPSRRAVRARAGWIPPPYPGFADNTVVQLN